MTNKHIRDLRMLASFNGVRKDDQKILLDAANAIDTMLAEVRLLLAIEGSNTYMGKRLLQMLDEAFK